MPGTVLVVGAGFAGATYARELAEAGYRVEVIDRRSHIAGNAFDEEGPTGQRIHRYGPHLFHTNNKAVMDWLSRFGAFVPYEHRVQAVLPSGQLVPLPINRQTINTVFGVSLETPEQLQGFLDERAIGNASPANAGEYLESKIGSELTDLFFRPYNRKMWNLELEEIDAAVVKRIPLSLSDEDRYFPNDAYQVMPRDGYTALVEAVLDHPQIGVTTGTAFEKQMLSEFEACFNSMPIDEFYEERFGPLPYRSIRFHHERSPADQTLGSAATINFTDAGRFTRQTDWSLIPCHRLQETGSKTLTREEPCDYRDNGMERYYPVKVSDGRYDLAYRRYKAEADKEQGLTFIGRCGTYQYLDMHQVINQSIAGARAWISEHQEA